MSWVNSVSTTDKEMCSAEAEEPYPELGNVKEWGRTWFSIAHVPLNFFVPYNFEKCVWMLEAFIFYGGNKITVSMVILTINSSSSGGHSFGLWYIFLWHNYLHFSHSLLGKRSFHKRFHSPLCSLKYTITSSRRIQTHYL